MNTRSRIIIGGCCSWPQKPGTDRNRRALRSPSLGLTFEDPHGCPKTRPEVAIERDSRLAFARLVRELDLDVEAAGVEGWGRPPALRSNRG